MVGTVTINYYFKRIDVMRILNIYWLQLMDMTITIKYKLIECLRKYSITS